MRGKLFQRLSDPRTLYQAFRRIRRKRLRADIDDHTIDAFQRRLNRHLQELSAALREGRYVPEPARRIHIPKPGKPGQTRTIALAGLRDKIVQEAVRSTIEPLFNPLFLDCSYAYRPNKGPRKAIGRVEHYLRNGCEWATVCDIDDFFDSIDHALLMKRVRARIWEPEVLRLIEMWLRMGVIDRGRWVDVDAGVPQGAIISPLLSNIYLHPFDEQMTGAGYHLVRYGDDCLVLSRDRQTATAALQMATTVLQKLRLRLNPEARPIAHVNAGFVFLGFLFKGERKSIAPEKLQQMQRHLRQRLREFDRMALPRVINELNETLSGWRRYYGMGVVSDQFAFLETVLIDQLAALLQRQCEAGHLSRLEEARPALERIEWLTTDDLGEQEKLVERVMERFRHRRASAQASSAAESSAASPAAPSASRSPAPVKKVVAQKRRQVEKRWAREGELIVSQWGSSVGKTQRRVVVRVRGRKVREIPFFRLKSISLTSDGISLSTRLIRYCATEGIPIHFIDYDGRAYAHLVGPRFPVFRLSKAQVEAARSSRGLDLAAAFVRGKIRNQINLIKYYAKSRRRRDTVLAAQCDEAIDQMRALLKEVTAIIADEDVERARGRLFALEGRSASHYWGFIKQLLSGDVFFTGRRRRGATDLVNSLLNYGYGILYGRVHEAIIVAGLNPHISFLHAEQVGKPTLVYDMVEEFRQPVVDKAIIGMIRRKEDLHMAGTKLSTATKQKVIEAVIERLNTRVRYRSTRVELREVIHRQARALADALMGKGQYRPFIDQW